MENILIKSTTHRQKKNYTLSDFFQRIFNYSKKQTEAVETQNNITAIVSIIKKYSDKNNNSYCMRVIFQLHNSYYQGKSGKYLRKIIDQKLHYVSKVNNNFEKKNF